MVPNKGIPLADGRFYMPEAEKDALPVSLRVPYCFFAMNRRRQKHLG